MVELYRGNREDYKRLLRLNQISCSKSLLYVEDRTWLPPSARGKNALDPDHATKYLHRTVIVLSPCHNRSNSYYSRNE